MPDIFVPQNWDGIKGIEVELNWKSSLPDRLKVNARPTNPRLFKHAKKEYDRLMQYMFQYSDSPHACALVIAPKATAPFIRFCGDYKPINAYIEIGHWPIPIVQHELSKIRRFRVFLDFDLANSFHQFRLGPITRRRLSIVTPWGQVEPRFLPEGVGPASFILQEHMKKIFAEYDDFVVCIFDNLLVLGEDYADLLRKAELILKKCKEYNLFLKFSKTWLGFSSVKFFGYICQHNSYRLDDERFQALSDMPLPRTLKAMQSFLGAALFFKDFVPHFAELATPLYDMIRSTFVWNDSSWSESKLASFKKFLAALKDSVAIFYPDYELVWQLRADASTLGVGFVLFQLIPKEGKPAEIQVIMLGSQKFSPQARNWATIEQEAYSIYYAVLKCSYLLRCKSFILETDHNNLLWMEKSEVPKIIRWRIYLQSFVFLLRHIPGSLNLVADFFSRHGFALDE